jgi:2-polyprenyl-3-methyl-5-hydroxy-6-metoxy-1,4-benzoquinol methylase
MLPRIRIEHTVNYHAWLADQVRGRRVLDIGCIDGNYQAPPLHTMLRRHARSVDGLDIDAQGVAALQKTGLSVYRHDISGPEPWPQRYEVVVASHVIEHLGNPVQALANMAASLEDGGTLIVATPNPFYIGHLPLIALAGVVLLNYDHVMWFCPETMLSLAQRCGLTVRAVYVSCSSRYLGGILRLPMYFRRLWGGNLIFVMERAIAPKE